MRISARVSTIPIYLSFLLLPVACIQQTPPPQEAVRREPIRSASPPVPLCVPEAPTTPRGVSDKWAKLQHVDAELTDEESRSFQHISRKGSDVDLQAALLVVSTLQLCVKQNKTLDIVATEWGVSLVEQFEHNPFLQGYDIQVLLLTSLARCSTQNPDLGKQLHAGVSQRQEKWTHLSQQFPQLHTGTAAGAPSATPADTGAAAGLPLAPSVPLPVPAVPTPAATVAAPITSPAPATEAQSSEKKLEEIDHLADSTDPLERKKAIEMLRAMVSAAAKDPATQGALTEKLATTCEQAVQQLRALAAKQFQDALPLAEGATRTEYLQAAQKSLQQALAYKEARPKTLQRVEENLHIIEESLQKPAR